VVYAPGEGEVEMDGKLNRDVESTTPTAAPNILNKMRTDPGDSRFIVFRVTDNISLQA
jgi:hypothetical protein